MNLSISSTNTSTETIEEIISPFSLEVFPAAYYSLRDLHESGSYVMQIRDVNMIVSNASEQDLPACKDCTVHSWLDQGPDKLHLTTTKRPKLNEQQWIAERIRLFPAIQFEDISYLLSEAPGLSLGATSAMHLFVVSSGDITVQVGPIIQNIKQAPGVAHYSFDQEIAELDQELSDQCVSITGSGQIVELLIYNRPLTADNIDKISKWQKYYWG